jgi:quinol monooxygenase YgiN
MTSGVKLEGESSVVSIKEKAMSNKMTLVVRFLMDEAVKKEFIAKLQTVFTHIVKEETFVEASLVQDMRDPRSILNYEVWNERPESFMKNQMSKAYRAEFEKMIVDLKIDRTPAWYSTIADWKKT